MSELSRRIALSDGDEFAAEYLFGGHDHLVSADLAKAIREAHASQQVEVGEIMDDDDDDGRDGGLLAPLYDDDTANAILLGREAELRRQANPEAFLKELDEDEL